MIYVLLLITVVGETLSDQTLTGSWIFLEIFEKSILLKNRGNEDDTIDGYS